MKKLFLLVSVASVVFYGCSSDEDIKEDVPNTPNSILITGISESISYTFTSKNGRTESSVPDDVNMIQILILNHDNEVVYEQYHYNQNAYNHYYYDSADHGGDDYMFENTLPDTLYIPPLADGNYTVLASTTYASYYNYYYEHGDSANMKYPIIESYQVSDGPIFVGKATAEVTADTDALVVLDMKNISARIDLNVESSFDEWSLEVQMETGNSKFYSFEYESLKPTEYDYDYLNLWRDNYWKQTSFYFLPRDLMNIQLWFYEYRSNFNLNFEFDIDPDLALETGDVFSLNIDLDELIDGGGQAAFDWEEIDWNDVGELNIP